MSREPDIKLLFGVEGGASIDQGSGRQILDDLKEIVKGINGKDVLKVKVGLDDGSAKEFKEKIKGIMSGADAGVEIKVAGLDKTASDAGKTAKALDSVAASAKKAGQAAKESSGDALTRGTKEYNDALTKINSLLIQLRNNQRNWSAAANGAGATDINRIREQVSALQNLEARLVSGELSAEDFANEISRIKSVASDAAESINRLGENHLIKEDQAASLKEVIALYDRIDKYLLKNSNAIGTEQYSSLKNIRDNLYGIVQAGDAAGDGMTKMSKTDFKNLNSQVSSLQSSLRDAGREGNTFAKTIVAAYQKFGGWMLVTQSLTKVVSGLRQMVENVKQIDAAMTELKKVTNETAATYDSFLIKAQARAAQLGATVADVVTATADFARLGHSLEDATALADAALVYKNVGDGIEDISTASESIISTMQAFGYEADQAMLIVDKFNAIGNAYAVSSSGLGEALVRSASAMAAANNTLDETIALATASNTILQNPQVVGTTLRSISMFLRAAKTEAEEAGESTEGMANSVSELRDEILALTGNRVDIQIDED